MVIIDAGHGGFDPGGGSNELFKEKDMALDISLYQYQRLKDLGIDVVLVRDNDILLTPNKRIEKIKSFNAGANDILISNHINSSSSGFKGAEVIYSINKSDKLPNLIASNIEEKGQSINRIFTRKNYKGNDYYFIIRDTQPIESIIIEYGFGTNNEDVKFLNSNYEALAEGVVKAIAEYLGYKYTLPYSINYKVKNGDSLYKISKTYNTTIDELKQLNNLTSNDLSINQIIKIPYRKRINYYLKDESLRDVANKFDLKIDEIKQYNNLNTCYPNEGNIAIPFKNSLVPYKIKYGDTLYKISKMSNTSISQIMAINNMENPIIEVGCIIMLPKA